MAEGERAVAGRALRRAPAQRIEITGAARMAGFLLPLLLVLLAVAAPARAADDWTGTWEVHWRDSGGRLILEQNGDTVTGQYPLYGGRVEGKLAGSDGERLEGGWSVGSRRGRFIAVMSRDGRTFTGRFDDGEVWTGKRTELPSYVPAIGRGTPREAFTRFVAAGNLAASGRDDAWGVAAQSVDFGAAGAGMSRTMQLHLLRKLFELVDLTTFRYWSVPDPGPGIDSVELRLEQARSGVVLPLTMRRDAEGNWRIVLPGEAEMHAAHEALTAIYAGKPPAADAYRRLQNPRDTMRAFLVGMADWDGAGRALALSTLNVSSVPALLRTTYGELSAQYLRRVLNHIGLVGLQAIPNDGTSREPYVHFVHGVGNIVIAPSGPAADAPWQFTPETVATIRDVYLATEHLPPPLATPPGLIPESVFFTLREQVAKSAPFLLGRVRELEYWQLFGALLASAAAILFGMAGSALVCAGLRRVPGGTDESPWFRRALIALIALAVLRQVPSSLGLAEGFREYSLPFWGIVASLAGGLVAWHVLEVLGDFMALLARRTATPTDDIVVTLLLAAARLAIVVAGALAIAHFLSIPTNNLLAGLGIGGLALAFASRETLSNVFGAAILVADRPFRRGDWIKIGDIVGAVEHVGIRSTRLRTALDSVVFVPNGKLVDSTINNYGAARLRVLKLAVQVTGGGTPERLKDFVAAIRARVAADRAFLPDQVTIGIFSSNDKGVTVETIACLSAGADEEATRDALSIDVFRFARDGGLVLGAGVKVAAPPQPQPQPD